MKTQLYILANNNSPTITTTKIRHNLLQDTTKTIPMIMQITTTAINPITRKVRRCVCVSTWNVGYVKFQINRMNSLKQHRVMTIIMHHQQRWQEVSNAISRPSTISRTTNRPPFPAIRKSRINKWIINAILLTPFRAAPSKDDPYAWENQPTLSSHETAKAEPPSRPAPPPSRPEPPKAQTG